jgi:hypothetical protein
MDNLQELQAVSDAIRIVSNTRREVAGGSMVVWQKLNRVEKYLDDFAGELFKEMTA